MAPKPAKDGYPWPEHGDRALLPPPSAGSTPDNGILVGRKRRAVGSSRYGDAVGNLGEERSKIGVVSVVWSAIANTGRMLTDRYGVARAGGEALLSVHHESAG